MLLSGQFIVYNGCFMKINTISKNQQSHSEIGLPIVWNVWQVFLWPKHVRVRNISIFVTAHCLLVNKLQVRWTMEGNGTKPPNILAR